MAEWWKVDEDAEELFYESEAYIYGNGLPAEVGDRCRELMEAVRFFDDAMDDLHSDEIPDGIVENLADRIFDLEIGLKALKVYYGFDEDRYLERVAVVMERRRRESLMDIPRGAM